MWLCIVVAVLAQDVFGPVQSGYVFGRRRIDEGGGGGDPFVYWTNPVPTRLLWAGTTNTSGQAVDSGAVGSNLVGYIAGATHVIVGTNANGDVKYAFKFKDDDAITNSTAFTGSPTGSYSNWGMSAWIKILRIGGTTINGYFLGRANQNATVANFFGLSGTIQASPTNRPFTLSSSTVKEDANSIPTNEWVWVYAGATGDYGVAACFMYTNGALSVGGALNYSGNASSVLWAGLRSDGLYGFDGLITDITVYNLPTNGALTQAQQTNIIAQTHPTNSHLALP
jgi:hypothetical protein